MAKKINLTKEDAKLINDYLDHVIEILDELIKQCRELIDILTNKSRVNNTSYYEKR